MYNGSWNKSIKISNFIFQLSQVLTNHIDNVVKVYEDVYAESGGPFY